MSKTASHHVPEGSRVRIRMYRQGIGDGFLLTFYGASEPRAILIDCGVLTGTPNGKDKIRRVAQNVAQSLAQETGGKLSALVATHEHWDHVSGFYDAKDIFDPMNIGEIWVAWTEDLSNPVASALKRQNKFKLQALHMALAHMASFGEPQYQAYGPGISELLGFFGGPADAAGMVGFSEKTSDAMSAVTQRNPAPTYFKPGDLIKRDWLPGVRVYVLGPPLDTAMLKKLQGKAGRETYGLTGADSAFATALAAALADPDAAPDPSLTGAIDAALPFDRSLQWRDEDKILKNRDFKRLYQEYQSEGEAWRRIDQDWLLSAARLGLQLDNATNNTSLVLAFEFTDTGKVLLFPADAQIGSWKSWLTLNWKVKESDTEEKTIDTPDLLRRTVFYKVGHHGSHNATLKEGGLEAMIAPELVAAIPVDQVFANNSKHWDMPAAPLYEALEERTGSRILRADATWPTPADPPPENLSNHEEERFKNFAKAVSLDPDGLFIDFFL
jgi:hypothetical protein